MKFILLAYFIFSTRSGDVLIQYKADYQHIMDGYKKHASISFTVTYNNFHNSNIVKPDTAIVAKYYIKGQEYYYSMAGAEIVRNRVYYIAVNHLLKTIVINDAAKMKGDFLPVSSIDSIIGKIPVTIKYSERDGGKTGSYKIDADDKQKAFNEMEMQFDKGSYLVNKIILFVSNDRVADYYGNVTGSTMNISKPRVDCVFGNYQFDHVDDRMFSTKRFVDVVGNEFKPAKEYAKYRIVSLIPITAQSK